MWSIIGWWIVVIWFFWMIDYIYPIKDCEEEIEEEDHEFLVPEADYIAQQYKDQAYCEELRSKLDLSHDLINTLTLQLAIKSKEYEILDKAFLIVIADRDRLMEHYEYTPKHDKI